MVGLVLLVEGIGSVGVWEFSSSSSLSRSKSVIFAAGLLTGRDLCSVGKAKVGGGRAAGGRDGRLGRGAGGVTHLCAFQQDVLWKNLAQDVHGMGHALPLKTLRQPPHALFGGWRLGRLPLGNTVVSG